MMTIKELKEAIAKLPDDYVVVVEVGHSKSYWLDTSTPDVQTDTYPNCDVLRIIAKIDERIYENDND